jgi:SAM-dependent methyltransferase
MTSAGMPDPASYAVFDRKLVRARRDRAAANFGAHSFLVERAGSELLERLEGIERTFTLALDLGCHTGTLRRLSEARNLPGFIVSSDLSPAMTAQASSPRLVADEERLPIADESVDLILSVLSLHWVNDLPGALIQIRRALRPDGLFLGAIFGGETLTELRQSLMDAESEIEGGVSPRISPFTDLQDGGSLLQRAGLALPVMDSDRITVRYDHPLKLMAELRGMGETNALLERRRTPMKRATLMRACEIYQKRFGLPDGRVPATFEILYLSGWAPHESQQKPLRPGSAQTRLADALGVAEHNVKR